MSFQPSPKQEKRVGRELRASSLPQAAKAKAPKGVTKELKPKEYGNLFTDDFMLWEGFSGMGKGGGRPAVFEGKPLVLPSLIRITPDELEKEFLCRNLGGIWTPKHKASAENRITRLQTFGNTFFPMMSRQYFPISWGSWESFRLEGEKYPVLEDAVEPN